MKPTLRDDKVDAVIVHFRLGESEARNRGDGADISVAELLFSLVEIHQGRPQIMCDLILWQSALPTEAEEL